MAENPEATVENEVPPAAPVEEDVQKQKDKDKKKKHRHRHHRQPKKWEPNFNIPGVHKVVLNVHTQQMLGVTAGDKVTAEKPWISVEKEVLQENLEFHSESSELLPLKDDINEFTGTEVLVGYVPDESKDYDEYYMCLTEDATNQVKDIITRMQVIQEERLRNAINKSIRPWSTLGSAEEIDCNIYRNNRALIEVEIESKYPILPFTVQYKALQAQAMQDGYMELRPTEDIQIIQKKRIDNGTQVAPSTLSREAQTICTYPHNVATQYECLIDNKLAELTPELSTSLSKYFKQNNEELYDMLKVNGKINFYTEDYSDLVQKSLEGNRSHETKKLTEYLSFVNMELCGGKKVSQICFSPFWTGTFVLAYVDVAPSLYITKQPVEDEVLRAVHGSNPVLLWSFLDDLRPKLILESPREVFCIKFCPFNENLLMGGCVNGQIILWDITNKLNKVEAEEILTADQQKYRGYMHSLMTWMKNIKDLALVRPTAVSDLKNSHSDCVNSIKWMSTFHKVSKTGRISQIAEDAERSLQLLTSSEDGTILIWDLLMKPSVQAGGFKAVRKMKRLKRRPSALTVDASPFRHLHLNLRPIYRIRINNMEHRPLSISSFYIKLHRVPYVLDDNFPRKKKPKLSDRIIYKAVLDYPETPVPHEAKFVLGTLEGDFIEAKWEGQDFDSGELVNSEEAHFVSSAKYHDGPIHWLAHSRKNEIYLTVGGKIFALWSSNFKNRPILWRRSCSVYTQGAFYLNDSSNIILSRSDGVSERWMLYHKSKSYVDSDLSSSGAINTRRTHDRRLGEPPDISVIGFADYRGALRLFYKHDPVSELPIILEHHKRMKKYLENEITRKTDFMTWQNFWNHKYNEIVEHYREETERYTEAEINTSDKDPNEKAGGPKKTGKCSNVRKVEWTLSPSDQERIKKCVLTKKQFDTELLRKQRLPLDILERENELKRTKQKIRLRRADKIFKDTVGMLFPDVVKEKPVPPPDPYEGGGDPQVKIQIYRDYQVISVEAQDYIESNPFDYYFNWLTVLKEGRERRKILDRTFDSAIHKRRWAEIKERYFSDQKSQQKFNVYDDDTQSMQSEWTDSQEYESKVELLGEQGGERTAT